MPNRHGVCATCGGKTVRGRKFCSRTCWAKRGPDGPPRVEYGTVCGHKVRRKGAERCFTCYKKHQQETAKGPRRFTASECGHPCSIRGAKLCGPCDKPGLSIATPKVQVSAETELGKAILSAIKPFGATLDQLASATAHTPGQVLDEILALKARGLNLHEFGGTWSLERHMAIEERTFQYTSRNDNTFVFGSASDAHLCSRYAREDVLGDLYDRFESRAVDRVFNAGNWIDGEDDKNRFDLAVHGLEPQVKYLAERFPKRDGLTTYAVWGEDHEGWFARREAIDVGRFTEGQMRQAHREDWVDLGFIEAKIDLVNANTGKAATLVVMHPGGGSSYAYSYRSQKIVESFSGGEKPAVLIIGHYHKLNCNIIRNVWTIQAGCTMDQSVFMRKKGLEAHVGGMIISLEQDPETGAIFRCVADQMIYFDRRYYNDRWSKTQAVVQAPRFLGGVEKIGA